MTDVTRIYMTGLQYKTQNPAYILIINQDKLGVPEYRNKHDVPEYRDKQDVLECKDKQDVPE